MANLTRTKSSRCARQRAAGLLISGGSVLQLVAAALPDARVFTVDQPVARMQAIAARKRGWVLQALLFPVSFATVAAGVGVMATALPDVRSRRLAAAGGLLGALATLLWLPISRHRLELTGRALTLAADPDAAAVTTIGGPTFWPYSVTAVGSVLATGVAVSLADWRRRLGMGVASAAAVGFVLMPLLRDWPPFVTYVLALVLGVGVATSDGKSRLAAAR